MKKLVALFSGLMVLATTSVFAACPIKHNYSCGCPVIKQKVSMATPCCKQQVMQPRCGCKVIKRNPCTGQIEKGFMGRTADGARTVYSNTIGSWYDASFGALFNGFGW